MKLFIAQINPTVGDIEKNSRLIVKAIEQAKEAQASLVVFPQMALTGYPPHDLLRNRAFTAAISEAWHTIAEACQGLKAIVGSPIVCQEDEEETLYNGAVLLSHTEKAEIIPLQASALHDHSWFAASDYFNNGSAIASAITCEDYKVILSIDDEILDEEFASLAQQEKQSGNKQILAINLAARPFISGQWKQHVALLQQRAQELGVHILEANLVGGQDQIILEGGSLLISNQGQLLHYAPRFHEYCHLWTLSSQSTTQSMPLPAEDEKWAKESELAEAICLGLGDYMRKNGFTDVVLGISGGIDSALCAALAVKTLGSEHVHGIYMPSRFSTDISEEEVAKLCRSLGIDLQLLPIEGPRAAFTELLAPAFAGRSFDITEENIQARIRAILVMAMSNKFGWLAICTGNKAEEAVGYSTLYGDGAGGIAPIMDLYKNEVRSLCRYLNKDKEIIPSLIITRPPSAELHEGQKDSDSLPDYDVLDAMLKAYLEEGHTKAELKAEGFDEAMVEKVIRLVERSEFKRQQGPIGLKLSPMLLGLDRHMPITKGIRAL